MPSNVATVKVPPNLALNKYWGTKPNAPKNTALHNNVAVSLGGLETTTTVHIGGKQDSFAINGKPVDDAAALRLREHVDYMRQEMGFDKPVEMRSFNDYPTSSGLASSAAGFAALTLATAKAIGYKGDEMDLSKIARHGSGSACRSVPVGGFTEWIADLGYARSLAPSKHWIDFRIVVGVASEEQKSVSSQEAMKRSRDSPLYAEWVKLGDADYAQIRSAVLERDLHSLGEAAERNAFRMHELIRSTGVDYWNKQSWSMLQSVQDLRKRGAEAWATSDAGSHIKVFCLKENEQTVRDTLAKNGALRTIVSRVGQGPRYV